MATGRCGGTKSKVSGVIGSEIYTIRKTSGRSYQQVVSAKPEVRTDTLTPEKIRQRICMSMIYKYMHIFSDYIVANWKDGKTASEKLNNFVAYNVKYLKQIMESGGSSRYQVWYYDYQDLNLYPQAIFLTLTSYLPPIVYETGVAGHNTYYTINFYIRLWDVNITVDEFYRFYQLKYGTVTDIFFLDMYEDPGRNVFRHIQITYIGGLPGSTVITADNFFSLFRIDAPYPVTLSVGTDSGTGALRPSIYIDSRNWDHAIRIGQIFIIRPTTQNTGPADLYGSSHLLPINNVGSNVRKDLNDVWASWYTDRK